MAPSPAGDGQGGGRGLSPILYFWIVLKASLLSTGGFGSLPSIHSDLMARGWASERIFVESMAVGQIAPGPNGLWVVSLGYMVDGWRGALLSALAVTLPPFLLLAVDRIYQRVRHHDAVEGFMRGLGLAVIGVVAVVLWGFISTEGVNLKTLTIALGAVGLGLMKKVPVAVIVLGAGFLGAIWA
ncbi:MAG: chromate transporter [Acetobacteraceae bacterium]|nr:MAG: chromate transporter [Acetobacteraceae bacterium]